MASAGRDMEINRWRQTMGFANSDTKLRMTRSWDASKKPPESKGPKHGKVLALLVQKYLLTGTIVRKYKY